MIAFTFPGQGSQAPGMGRDWVDHPSWGVVERAAETSGRDIAALLLEAEADELTETRNAQLATFVMSMVVLDAVTAAGHQSSHVAGHSLGEYSALCAAGVLDLADAVRLVAERGEAMQVAAASPKGTMAAVLGLDDDKVDEACRSVSGEVWVANYNAPGQVVIAGAPEAVETAGTAAKDLGGKRVMPLKVAGAFHTPYMAPAQDRLNAALAEVPFRDASVPVVTNVDGDAHQSKEDWLGLLQAQLTSPVRWRHGLSRLASLGVTTFVELGPGTVLTGTVKRTVEGGSALSASTPDEVAALGASL